jgi:hypothetical protein
LLASRGFDTPSLSAQGGQRRSRFLNIGRDITLLKIAYDLALLWAFRHIRPPEERARAAGGV